MLREGKVQNNNLVQENDSYTRLCSHSFIQLVFKWNLVSFIL